MQKVQSVLFIALLLAVTALLPSLISSQQELRNAKQNARWALEQSQNYRVQDSLSALSINRLILERKELQEFRQKDLDLIGQLRLDLKRIKSIGGIQTQTVYQIKTEVRDSLVFLKDTVQCFSHQSRWARVEGCLLADSVKLQIQSIDSLVYIEHVVPKRFWFIQWGVKSRRQEILSKNPNTTITSAEFIKVEQ